MNLSNSYLNLGDRFYERIEPLAVARPGLFLWNDELADQLMISSDLRDDAALLAETFSGNRLLKGSTPVALVYAGHQFGQFNPQLGDGRAHLLGELVDRHGKKWEVQLKGSGPTSFSRGGDGRCAIGPAIREYIMSEAMAALGVPTSRCLAVVLTGESVFREQAFPGAVVTRLASSHLRIGTFQYFAARRDHEALQTLCDFSIEQIYPEIKSGNDNKLVALLEAVIERQTQLVIEWMRVGFIHGVMNTDNMAISGETIDFGPCAMMGNYDPETVYSSIDRGGRYAFGNQPNILFWNLARFAECLLVLVAEDDEQTFQRVESLIGEMPELFSNDYGEMMGRKFGLQSLVAEDAGLINALLEQFQIRKLDYTATFDLLTRSLTSDSDRAIAAQELGEVFTLWKKRVLEQENSIEETQALMRGHNPVVIPRNHHVEALIEECEQGGDRSRLQDFLEVLRSPYRSSAMTAHYQDLPEDRDEHYQTFCGT